MNTYRIHPDFNASRQVSARSLLSLALVLLLIGGAAVLQMTADPSRAVRSTARTSVTPAVTVVHGPSATPAPPAPEAGAPSWSDPTTASCPWDPDVQSDSDLER